MPDTACRSLRRPCSTSSNGLSLIRPATGSVSSAVTLPSAAAAKPPLISINRFTAAAMSESVHPMTQTLWLSWPTDEALAPLRRPSPPTKACPTLPWRLCRRRHQPAIERAEMAGRRAGGGAVGIERPHAAADGGADQVVDMAFLGDVERVAVVGAERQEGCALGRE